MRRSRRQSGATQTFRRASNSTSFTAASQQQDANASQPPPRYVPPHRNGTITDTRYTKEQLLDLYKAQQTSESGLNDGLSSLFLGGWQPDSTNGASSGSWGRSDNARDGQPGPDICWDREGANEPLGFIDMDDEEREVCWSLDMLEYVWLSAHAKTRPAFLNICKHSTQAANLE